jgi:hypothetical protein
MNIKIISLISFLAIAGALVWFINGGQNTADLKATAGSATTQKSQELSVTSATDFISVRPAVAALPEQAISNEEQAGLIFMREEEKLARDVYSVLYDKWGLQIFSNIAQSEQTHTEAVRTILTKYNIADPVTDDTIGVFVNSDLQKLYTDLTTRGTVSLEEALTIGALIEDLDISDLQKQIALTDNDDIKLVYENLMRGSRNHLRAFTSQLSSRGKTYTPQHITQSEFDAIIASSQETGSGSGGRGWGKNR